MATVSSKAQQDDGADEKIRDKMREYIQQRMQLTKAESEKFIPIFIRYFREWRTTLRENTGPRIILQQKIIELRVRYRPEFKEILGENRCDQIFEHQDRFIRELKEIRRERIEQRQEKLRDKPIRQGRIMIQREI